LDSLIKINYPKDGFEVIVCDNCSTDTTKKIVHDFIQAHQDFTIRYLFEGRSGVHYARNTAAKFSVGKYLYFTDDDMLFGQDVFHEVLALFSRNLLVGCVSGPVLPSWEQEPPLWVSTLYLNGYLSLSNPSYDLDISDDYSLIFSCHQMIRREVFFDSGGFNPENTKGEWIGDGETGLNIKIKSLGYKFGFTRKATIYHIIPKERLTQKYFNKRFYNQGNCDSYTHYKAVLPNTFKLLSGIPVKFVFSLKELANSLRYRFSGSCRWRYHYPRAFYWFARIRYDWRLVCDGSWRALVLRRNWLDE
jgi:glycosyltransferase involved in cell wall biosynthesis